MKQEVLSDSRTSFVLMAAHEGRIDRLMRAMHTKNRSFVIRETMSCGLRELEQDYKKELNQLKD